MTKESLMETIKNPIFQWLGTAAVMMAVFIFYILFDGVSDNSSDITDVKINYATNERVDRETNALRKDIKDLENTIGNRLDRIEQSILDLHTKLGDK